MRRLPALVAALLLPAAQPVLLSAAVSGAALLAAQAPVQAQSAEAVGRVAKAITVRIEGATQGSGVLVKREGNRYTVLTAWHVVSSQGPREELDVYTPDGKRHSVEQGSIKKVKQSDTATLSFASSASYLVPSSATRLAPAEDIYIYGFPLDSPGSLGVSVARIIGNTDCQSQTAGGGLLYKIEIPKNAGKKEVGLKERYESSHKFIVNPHLDTRSGMSGGPILTKDGLLVGHHNGGLGIASDSGVAIKMGLNRGSLVPENAPHIAGYVNSRAVCAILSAQEASLNGMDSDAANFALDAYKTDAKAMPFISDVLNVSLLKLGRFRDLCELQAAGAQLNNASLDFICQGGVPGLYSPR